MRKESYPSCAKCCNQNRMECMYHCAESAVVYNCPFAEGGDESAPSIATTMRWWSHIKRNNRKERAAEAEQLLKKALRRRYSPRWMPLREEASPARFHEINKFFNEKYRAHIKTPKEAAHTA